MIKNIRIVPISEGDGLELEKSIIVKSDKKGNFVIDLKKFAGYKDYVLYKMEGIRNDKSL